MRCKISKKILGQKLVSNIEYRISEYHIRLFAETAAADRLQSAYCLDVLRVRITILVVIPALVRIHLIFTEPDVKFTSRCIHITAISCSISTFCQASAQ